MNDSTTRMKKFFDRNMIQDYGFLSCRTELLSLAIVLTYDRTENSGIRIKSTRAVRNFTLIHSCYLSQLQQFSVLLYLQTLSKIISGLISFTVLTN